MPIIDTQLSPAVTGVLLVFIRTPRIPNSTYLFGLCMREFNAVKKKDKSELFIGLFKCINCIVIYAKYMNNIKSACFLFFQSCSFHSLHLITPFFVEYCRYFRFNINNAWINRFYTVLTLSTYICFRIIFHAFVSPAGSCVCVCVVKIIIKIWNS